MKIIFNIIDLKHDSGGISRLTYIYLKSLKKKIKNLSVLQLFNSNINISIKRSICFNFKFLFCIRNFFNQIYQLFDKSLLIIYNHPNLLKCHFFQTNYITMLYGIDIWQLKSKTILKKILNSKKIIFCSNFTKKTAEKIHNVKFKNSLIIYPSTPQNHAPTKVIYKKRGNNLIIIGRLTDSLKGHYDLFDALIHIKDRINNLMLHVVGEGLEKERMIKYVYKKKLNNNVKFHGFLNSFELNKLLLISDIFVMPSRSEGFGIVYIEAMRYSLPIIASIHDAGCEVNINGVTGYNVNLNKKNDLNKKLFFLLKNKSVRKNLAKNSFNLWKNKFKYKNFEKRLCSLIH